MRISLEMFSQAFWQSMDSCQAISECLIEWIVESFQNQETHFQRASVSVYVSRISRCSVEL